MSLATRANGRSQLRPLSELLVVGVVSWVAGVVGSVALSLLVFHQAPGSDFLIAAGWAAGTLAVAILAVYLPILHALAHLRRPAAPGIAALIGMVLSVIPLGLLHYLWEGRFRVAVDDVTARIFLPIFAIAGAVFGYGSVDQE